MDPNKLDSHPSHRAIRRRYLEIAIKNHLGDHVTLKSFQIEDFVKKGTNFMCVVTSVICQVNNLGKEEQVTYVVKVNPKRPMNSMREALYNTFVREGLFLLEILPALNEVLMSHGLEPLNFPKCYFGTWEGEDQILILEDLRLSGFSTNSRKSVKPEEMEATIKELAKLHASSQILLKQLNKDHLMELYPFIQTEWLPNGSPIYKQWRKFMSNIMNTASQILMEIPEYSGIATWVEKEQLNAIQVTKSIFSEDEEGQFFGLCHGDVWGSNILYREQDGILSAAMVDLQMCRYGPVTLDLQKSIHCGFLGGGRESALKFLESYWEHSQNIYSACGYEIPFTEDELKKDFDKRKLHGVAGGLVTLSVVSSSSNQALDMDKMSDDNIDQIASDMSNCTKNLVANDPNFRKTFLDMFSLNKW